MPKILFIESCLSQSQVYLRGNDSHNSIRLLSETSSTAQDVFIFQSLKTLFPTRESWSALSGLAVVIGPGRFNAVRVACAIVATLQAVSSLPIYTLRSYDLLDAMSEDKPWKGSAIFAKKGFVYYRERGLSGDGDLISLREVSSQSLYWGPPQEDCDFSESVERLDLDVFYDLILENKTERVTEPLDLRPAYCALV